MKKNPEEVTLEDYLKDERDKIFGILSLWSKDNNHGPSYDRLKGYHAAICRELRLLKEFDRKKGEKNESAK